MLRWLIASLFCFCILVGLTQDEKSSTSSFSKSPQKYQKRKSRSKSKKRLVFAVNYLDSANYYKASDPSKALDFIEAELKNNLAENNKVKESSSYQLLGEIYTNLDKIPDAIVNYEKAIYISEKLNSDQGYEQYFLLGKAHFSNKSYDEALRYFYGFESYANLKNNIENKMKVNLEIGKVYRAQGKTKKAEQTIRKAIELGEKHQLKSSNSYANANGILGEILLNNDQDDEALQRLNTAYNSNTTEIKTSQQAADNIEELLIKGNKYSEALELRQQEKQANIKLLDSTALLESNKKISNVFAIQNQWGNAIPYLKENIDLAKNRNDAIALAEGYKSLAKAYNGSEQKELALATSLLYNELADSINAQKELKTKKIIAYNNEISTKQKRISSLEKDRDLTQARLDLLIKNQEAKDREVEFQTTLTYGLLIVLILVIVGSYLLYRSSQQKKVANQLLALKSLRSQMNPHFIFNALNSVNSFIAKNDERAANKYLSDFSKLMRQVMENSKYDLVPLQSEIDILKIYIQLEHFRFSDKFDFEFIIDDSIETDEIEIPPMLIQPYIENAVWHGLRYRTSKGELTVELKAQDTYVEFTISDNGIGRKKSQELKTDNQKETKSTGMKNIESRLNIINEVNKMALKVDVSDFDTLNETGTIVKIQIPIKPF